VITSEVSYWRVLASPSLLAAVLARRARRLVVARALRQDVRRAVRRIAEDGRRGLFIDCGSNLGQGFAYFKRHFPASRFDYVLVEPNPYCVAHLRATLTGSADRVELIDAAASSGDGEAVLYGVAEGAADRTSQGGSIVTAHPSAWQPDATPEPISVRTFSLAQLIVSRKQAYPVIAMKMDIEGAEYDVLEDLIHTGAHRALHSVYVEFHSRYMRGAERRAYQRRESAIRARFAADGVPLRLWV
jgi:FkbM family methyltransferase